MEKVGIGQVKYMTATLLAGIAYVVATMGVNVTCTYFVHQPEVPETVKSLRKF